MKKGIKTFCKVLSVFLAVLFVIEILPLQVMAEDFTEAVAQKEFIEDLVNNPTDAEKDAEAEILYEVKEKRDEHTKVYKKSDGTYTAVMTEEPLHYLDEGVWKEIDNSMILDGSFYTNLSNLFNVELPKNIDENKELTVEKDGYELSFSVNDIENSSAVVENNIAASDTEIESADKAISQTQSLITYSDIAENTNLQYVITPNSIKENIIVSNKESVKDKYTFIFETNGLNAEKQNDGSIRFKDNNGNVKFTIPRPVMTDANFALSYDIGVSMKENTDSTITLEYSPSIDWTSSSDRVYPVFIDPAIIVDNQDVSWAEDVCVIDDSTNETDQDRNFYNDFLGMVVNTSIIDDGVEKSADAEIYTKINTEQLKSLGNNVIITEAQYLLAGASMNGRALAKEIAKPVDLTTVTYSTKPDLETEAFDYYTSPYVTDDDTNLVYAHFNITKPLNEWLSGEENNGFAIVAGDDNFYGLFYMNGVYSYTNPSTNVTTTKTYSTAMCFDYVDMGGYNENLNYHSQSAGRAGTGYVNDFTQQLSVIRNDINMTDNNFPVTIGMIYDTATYDKLELLNYKNMIAYGNNWVPNYLRAYLVDDENQLTYYTATGASIDFTRSISENGEVIYTESYSDIYGNHSYEIETTETEAEYITVTRPDGYIESFNNNGLLTCVTNPGDSSKSTSIVYDSVSRIDYIIDSVGRKYDYIYCSKTNLLSKIRCCTADCKHVIIECTHTTDDCTSEISNCTPITDGSTTAVLEIRYTYDENNNLETVTYPDGKSVKYEYDNNGNMISMTNIDDYRIAYEYEVKDNDEDVIEYTDKVASVTEQAKNGTTYVNGNAITYERLNSNQVKLTDATGDYEIYYFGNYGNLLYTIDNNGNYVMHEDVDSTDETHYASVSDYRSFSENLLSNPSFEETASDGSTPKDWVVTKTPSNQTNESSATSSDEEAALFGTNVLKLSCNDNESISVKQSVSALEGGEYTFSAYIITTEEISQPLTLKLYSNNTPQSDIATTSITTTNGKWERFWVTFDAPVNTEELTVELLNANCGTFYIDGVQLEQSAYASLHNYVQNGGFNNGLNHWTATANLDFEEANINGETVNALILPGGETEATEISQTVAIDGKHNDIIRVGAWFKGNYVNSATNNVWLNNLIEDSEDPKICNFTDDRYAYIEVKCGNTTTNATQIIKIPFNENLDDWQFVARDFSLNGYYDKATITIHYSQNINTALLSNIELTKTKVRTNYIVDNKCNCKNCIKSSCSCQCTSEKTCNCDECEHEIQCPCANCTVINCPCNCDSKDICYCTQCTPENENTKRDAFGNIMLGNNYDEIVTSQLLSQRIGDNVTVNYNLSNGLFKTFIDAAKTFTSYNYNNSGVLTQISANGNEIDFTYENDRIATINQNDTIYKFNYDGWGQVTQISIGNTPIVSYQYGSGEYRDRIIQATYYNDDSTHSITKFNYNDESNSIIISVNDTEKFICIFDKNGSLIEIQEKDGRKINYIDDKIEISKGEDEQIYKFDIDTDGNYIETIGDTCFTTKVFGLYNESCQYTDTVEVSSNGEKNIVAEAEFDAIGRYSPTSSAKININNTKKVTINNSYIYDDADIENNDFIAQLGIDENSKFCIMYTYIERTGVSLYDSYFFICIYDENNNVICESICDILGNKYYECDYVYDDNNQLIRVNQISHALQEYFYDDNNTYNTTPIVSAERSITYTYEYDNAGNICYKREYEYTTDENLQDHTPISVVEYGYNSDDVWKDKLTSFGDTIITYDNVGNPVSIGDKQLTWNGKQLETYIDGDKTINYEYDVNGFCHRKTVTLGDTTESYDYIWSDGKLHGQIYTDSVSNKYSIKYVYDLFNAPYGFIINNSDSNTEKMYLYLKDIKGDIIGIANEEGKLVITYEYDAWGSLSHPYIDDSDTFANVICKLPTTYRGYSYDYDTGLYYIQGRYYNPEMGRFINADNTSNLGSTGTALSYNLYAYCENNPVMYVVDNKNTEFSNTINSNYIYNKRISKNLSGFIDDQKNGIASKLRYGRNTIAPFGCGTVATYNALIMLGNRLDPCDIIRDYEMNNIYHYGLIGTHGNNIARFFNRKGYNVTITNLENYDFNNDEDLSAVNDIVKKNQANILYYKSSSVGHFIALKYDGQDSQGNEIYIAYNEYNTDNGKADSIDEFIPKNREPYMLISISTK